MVAYTIFQAHVMYVTFKIALNIQVYVSYKPCLYLFALWHKFMYFFLQGLPILSIYLINALSFNCYVCCQMIISYSEYLYTSCWLYMFKVCQRIYFKFIRLK